MPRGNIAIIGGTGFETLPPEIFAEKVEVTTPYGKARVLSLSNNYVEPYKLYFLSRHGETHGLAPHQIDYRANIAALAELDVRYLFASNAVGSLRKDLLPGTLVLFDDFIDFTRQRPLTYFQEGAPWQHTDFTTPYSPHLRQAVLAAAAGLDVTVVPTATYLCCDGPRFEVSGRSPAVWPVGRGCRGYDGPAGSGLRAGSRHRVCGAWYRHQSRGRADARTDRTYRRRQRDVGVDRHGPRTSPRCKRYRL